MKFYVFCTENVFTEPDRKVLVEDHKAVCEKLGVDVEYYTKPFSTYDQAAYDHGAMITEIIDGTPGVSCFMDLDCVPYDVELLRTAYTMTEEYKTFTGNAQNVSHTAMREYIYAAPSMLMVHRDAWLELGSPSMSCVREHVSPNGEYIDTAQQLSLNALEKNFKFNLLWPLGCDVPKWQLNARYVYGQGTLYPGSYHNFQGATEIGQNLDFWKKRINNILNDEQIVPEFIN